METKCDKCDGTGRFDAPEAICNLCGLTCSIGPVESPASGPHGLIRTTVSGGYSSTAGNGFGALDDCTSYRFSLCEFCLDWLFSRFKVPVDCSDCMGDGQETWRPAAQRVAEDKWRESKAEFFAEQERRAKARGA